MDGNQEFMATEEATASVQDKIGEQLQSDVNKLEQDERQQDVQRPSQEDNVNQESQSVQDVPEKAQDAPQEVQDSPLEAQDAPQEAQDVPQEAQDAPQEVHDAPQEVQDAPQKVQDAPEEVQDAREEVQDVPQEVQDVQQEVPEANDAPDVQASDGAEQGSLDIPLSVPDASEEVQDVDKPVEHANEVPADIAAAVNELSARGVSVGNDLGMMDLDDVPDEDDEASEATSEDPDDPEDAKDPPIKAEDDKTDLKVPLLVKTEDSRRPVETLDVGVGTEEHKPAQRSLGISVKVKTAPTETQTEKRPPPTILPLPCPMYMPMPMCMYQTAVPVPIPVPLPIPVPVFLPTTRNSIRGIKKQIRKIVKKVPSDQLEAELLRLAGDLDPNGKGDMDSDDSPYEDDDYYDDMDDQRQGYAAPPPEDLEKDIVAGRIMPKPLPIVTPDPILSPGPNDRFGQAQKRRYSQLGDNDENQQTRPPSTRGRGRGTRGAKYSRRDNNLNRDRTAPAQPPVPQPPKERPDAKHHLKFTYGVNAWKHWVVQKNAELEKARAQGKYMKTFETDILKLRADELIYTLCMFVKEVRKPDGEPYSPDSLFYLALGIQEYLLENGRIDNIFTDMYYEPFTNALHEVVKDFKLSVNELGYFVTRLEEEHLWESKQLGAHSPQVLLNTLIYFNTRYFLLKTVDQHKKLSFSHIMKHWKKVSSNVPLKGAPLQGQPQQKQILLRYYPPPNKGKGKVEDRRCYEQHENTTNPLRCPVKLYEFYLSKCPESTKTRNDLFYLQPERSCVPDSPVWYSTTPLNSHQLDKMLQRLLMIKEVQEHMIAEAEM